MKYNTCTLGTSSNDFIKKSSSTAPELEAEDTVTKQELVIKVAKGCLIHTCYWCKSTCVDVCGKHKLDIVNKNNTPKFLGHRVINYSKLPL